MLEPLIEKALADTSLEETEARLAAADLPYGRLNGIPEVAAHTQLTGRDRWREADTPAGVVRTLEPPFNLQGLSAAMGAVPAAGQDTDALLAELGYAPAAVSRLRAAGAVA
jgi:itaconate CoA-transferase